MIVSRLVFLEERKSFEGLPKILTNDNVNRFVNACKSLEKFLVDNESDMELVCFNIEGDSIVCNPNWEFVFEGLISRNAVYVDADFEYSRGIGFRESNTRDFWGNFESVPACKIGVCWKDLIKDR